MTFNQFLKSKDRKFKFNELITEYQEWLGLQGFTSSWLDAYDDVMESIRNIELAGVIGVLNK